MRSRIPAESSKNPPQRAQTSTVRRTISRITNHLSSHATRRLAARKAVSPARTSTAAKAGIALAGSLLLAACQHPLEPTTVVPVPVISSQPAGALPSSTQVQAGAPIKLQPGTRYPIVPQFIQGLEVVDGQLLVATGLYGTSTISYQPLPGAPAVAPLGETQVLDSSYFGEGATAVDTPAGRRVYQLTWRNHEVFVRDQSLQEIARLPLATEGWGLTHCDAGVLGQAGITAQPAPGPVLVLSDGSSRLYYFDSLFNPLGNVDTGIQQLNELECVGNLIFANEWMTNNIQVFRPNGQRVATLDASALTADSGASHNIDNVLNGIAYDPARDSFLITGKRWPKLYEVKLFDYLPRS